MAKSKEVVPSIGQTALERCLELVQAGTNLEDPEYTALYASLGPDNRELVDQARRMLPRLAIEDEARQAAAEIREAIAPGGQLPPQQMWLPCAPMPTDMCRVSPFFPLRQRDLRERPFLRGMVITSNSWGEIRYTGPKLSTYEEDVLLAGLALLDSNKNRYREQSEGKTTYTYRGPLLPVLRLLGYRGRSYGGTDYKRVLEPLKLMMSAVIEMEVHGRTTRGKKKTKKITMTNLVIFVDWDEEKKELIFTANPYFYEMYVAGSVTLIDVQERAKLNSPIAKSLMRFLLSHREPKWGPAHFLTLARALNLDLEQPPKKLRQLLKGAIKELLEQGWLEVGGFISKDIVEFTRGKASTNKQRLKS